MDTHTSKKLFLGKSQKRQQKFQLIEGYFDSVAIDWESNSYVLAVFMFDLKCNLFHYYVLSSWDIKLDILWKFQSSNT